MIVFSNDYCSPFYLYRLCKLRKSRDHVWKLHKIQAVVSLCPLPDGNEFGDGEDDDNLGNDGDGPFACRVHREQSQQESGITTDTQARFRTMAIWDTRRLCDSRDE